MPSSQSDGGFVASESVRPVLSCDFNSLRGGNQIAARRGDWLMEPGQRVLLDDQGGLRAEGTVIGPAEWGEGRYVIVQIDVDTYVDYDLKPGA